MNTIKRISATTFAIALIAFGGIFGGAPSAFAGYSADKGDNELEAWAWADVWGSNQAHCHAEHGGKVSDTGWQSDNNDVMAYASTGQKETHHSSFYEIK